MPEISLSAVSSLEKTARTRQYIIPPKNRRNSLGAIRDMCVGAVSVCVLDSCHEMAAESMPHNMRGNTMVRFPDTFLEDRVDENVSCFSRNRSSLPSG